MIKEFPYPDAALIVVASIALLLAGALVLEHGFYMEPCALCLTQRLFFMLAGIVALGGLASKAQHGAWPIATAGFLAVGAGFALRQLYLYALPADQVPACSAPINRLIEFAPLQEVLHAMTVGTGNCAEAWFPLFGMQLPGISIPLASLAGFLALLFVCWRQWQARL